MNVHAETCLRSTGLQDCDPTEMNFCICVHPQKYTDKKKSILLHAQEEEEEEEEEEELEEDAVERMRNDLNEVYDDDTNRLEAVQVSHINPFLSDYHI